MSPAPRGAHLVKCIDGGRLTHQYFLQILFCGLVNVTYPDGACSILSELLMKLVYERPLTSLRYS